MYSIEEMKKAVDLYIQYDKQLSKTIKTLGYPSRNSLRKWYYEFRDSGEFKDIYTRKQKYTEEQKESAVKELLLRKKTVKDIANNIGVDRVTLYNWKNQ